METRNSLVKVHKIPFPSESPVEIKLYTQKSYRDGDFLEATDCKY